MAPYRDKRVYIVGGSKGIGYAAACKFREREAAVVLFARGEQALREAADTLNSEFVGDDAVGYETLDVADPESVERAFASAVEAHGPPDIVINCAGMARPDYFEAIDAEDFDKTLRVNLHGTRHVAAAAYPHLADRQGHLVNVSSVAGYVGVFGMTDYCASKYGVIGFSEALRAEARLDGVGVSVLCPPDTRTPGFEEENRTKPPETHAVSEGGGLAEPEEVAETLLRDLRREKFLILPGTEPKLVYHASRLFPGIVRAAMDRDVDGATDGATNGVTDKTNPPPSPDEQTRPFPWVAILEAVTVALLVAAQVPGWSEWLLPSTDLFAFSIALALLLGADLLRGSIDGPRRLRTAGGCALIGIGLIQIDPMLEIASDPLSLENLAHFATTLWWFAIGTLLATRGG